MSFITGPIYKYLSAGLALIVVVLGVYAFILKGEVKELTAWQDDVVLAVQGASGNDEVDDGNAVEQILALGRSVESLRTGIAEQNKGIEKLERERDNAVHRAAVERARQQPVIDRARATADDLDEQSETPAENPDEAIRAAQDQAYEEGL